MKYVAVTTILICIAQLAMADAMPPLHEANPQAVQEVASGACTTASAAWWGFNESDVTETLQAALDSPAKTLIIPYMGEAWIVRPLKLHGDQEIVFEPGVLVLAKKGEFKGKGDSLFRASDVDNLTLRGYGATLRMHKKDYQHSPYEPAEWRMGVAIHGCKNVLIEGLHIESTGGDGVYIDGGPAHKWAEDVTVRNVVCYDNHRQGISVISARNLLIESCVLSGTWGTAPEAGIDFEPDIPENCLVNCVVRNTLFENNAGNAAAVHLNWLKHTSEPATILFENCVMRMGKAGDAAEVVRSAQAGGWGGMTVGAICDDAPKCTVEFRNCTSENTGREGARMYDLSADNARVRFVNCSWKDTWLNNPLDYDGPRSPISITLRRPEYTVKLGGVEFVECHVYDTEERPALVVHEDKSEFGVRDLSGHIAVHNPHGARADFGANAQNVSLELK